MTHMQAMLKMGMMASFVRLSICKFTTSQAGSKVNVKSVMMAKVLYAMVTLMMVSSARHVPAVEMRRVQANSTGEH